MTAKKIEDARIRRAIGEEDNIIAAAKECLRNIQPNEPGSARKKNARHLASQMTSRLRSADMYTPGAQLDWSLANNGALKSLNIVPSLDGHRLNGPIP